MPYTKEQATNLRDNKLRDTLLNLAPIWLVNDEFKPREDSLVFNLAYEDPSYGWMNRRYKYDAFNDVLYHMGWRLLNEEETLVIQDSEPYLPGEVAQHIPNAPGSRLSGETSFVPR